jgi:predicted nucleotidyltransferase
VIDITPQELTLVQDILRAQIPTAQVWVFGSRAKGTTRRGSDLDLAIDAKRKLTASETSVLAEAFDEAPLPYRVDLVDTHGISATFKAIIERDRVGLPGFMDVATLP